VNGWLRHHAHSAGRSFTRLATAPVSAILSALVIGATLALPLSGYTLVVNLEGLLPALAQRAEVNVFLAPGTQRADAEEVARGLRQYEGVMEVRFVSKESALAGLKRSAGLADIIGALPENPLPDAFVVVLARNDGDLGERVAAKARSFKNVAQVQADSGWMRTVQALLGLGRTAVALLAVLLGGALVAVTFNTIRLQILTQRAEIEVSRLVGATDAYIRRPFLYFGSLQGALGGLVAIAIVAGALAVLDQDVASVAAFYGSTVRLRLPDWQDCTGVVVAAALLGWLGAAISVSRHLRSEALQ
jgi:cell division transport system permease protein